MRKNVTPSLPDLFRQSKGVGAMDYPNKSGNDKVNAFTLVELSIVLVILGLLVGGVLAGQNLIRAAELRAIVTEKQSFETAVMTFREKYFALPGDIKNAEAFWGTAHATDANCLTTSGTGTQTCNGNGDGKIENSDRSYERPRFWQHLANDGLIDGTYSGLQGGGPVGKGCLNPGTNANCPSSKVNSALYMIDYYTGGLTADVYAHPASHFLNFGNNNLVNGLPQDSPVAAVLTTQEAWNLDTKLDNGKPASGIVLVTYRNGSSFAWAADTVNCSNNADPALAEYDLALEGISCSLKLLMGF